MNVIASERHYRAHLEPIAQLVDADVTLVASYKDLVTARKSGAERIVLAQHGAGQSYGGDPKSARHPAYPGGEDNGDVGLFLTPNEHAAQRWRDAYPRACVRVVGCPRLDTLPPKTIDPLDSHPVVAVSFHTDPHISPEARSAFGWYRSAVVGLAQRYKVLGHGHPRRTDLPKWYGRNGIEYVADFDEVCRRADVYVVDNSSTLFEFASTGRPVVVMNAPWYRRDVFHGLRFWHGEWIGEAVNYPSDLEDVVTDAIAHSWGLAGHVLDEVYAYRTGAAKRAADAILEWAS